MRGLVGERVYTAHPRTEPHKRREEPEGCPPNIVYWKPPPVLPQEIVLCLHGFWKTRAREIWPYRWGSGGAFRTSRNLTVSPGGGTLLTVLLLLFDRQHAALSSGASEASPTKGGSRPSDSPWMVSASEYFQRAAHNLDLLEWDPPSLHAAGPWR